MLEVLNLARTNPAEGARWVRDHTDATIRANLQFYGVDLDEVSSQIAAAKAQPPLAWDGRLAAAAQQHSEDMAAKGYQSHEQEDEATRTPGKRLDRVGYTDRVSDSENAFAYVRPTDLGEKLDETAVDNAMQAFLIDWGVANQAHRRKILEPEKGSEQASADVGLGFADVTRADLLQRGFGPKVVTQVFARQANSSARIVGVVYEDADKDGRFSLREGRGDVEVSIENLATRQTQSLPTWDTGGYQAEVAPGTYRVSARAGRQSLGSRVVDVGSANIKVDFEVGRAIPEESPASPLPIGPVAPPSSDVSTLPAVDREAQATSTPPVDGPMAVAMGDVPETKPAVAASQLEVQLPTRAEVSQPATSDTGHIGTSSHPKAWLDSKVVWGKGWKASS